MLHNTNETKILAEGFYDNSGLMGQTYSEQRYDSYTHKQAREVELPSTFLLSPVTSNESASDNLTSIDEQLAQERLSPLLALPIEVLYQIIELVYYDDNTSSINANLEKFSKTVPLLSRTLHRLSLMFLYKYAVFNRPHSFSKFLHNLVKTPDLGGYVEIMDFQTFTSIGLGRTGRMNQEIQMVTSETIKHALSLTPNLIEFLASENIQDDMDWMVLDELFNKHPKIQALDFCGASSERFAKAFHELVIYDSRQVVRDEEEVVNTNSLQHLFKISFHDCSNLHPEIFAKVLSSIPFLRRLDLSHTAITSSILCAYLPHTTRLTHLSLARCSKLTTRDLIEFLVSHPAVANNTLKWLNLQIDSNVVSPLSNAYLLYMLKNLKASELRYLNLGGLPVNKITLHTIKQKFVHLESLSISHATVDLNDLNDYLAINSALKYIDISGVKGLSRWDVTTLLQSNFDSNLMAIESDYKTLWELTGGNFTRILPIHNSILDDSVEPQIWKFHDNEGRRAWLYKVDKSDPTYSSYLNRSTNTKNTKSNLVYYDLETGEKIETKTQLPLFLKYASKKINCSIGYYKMKSAKNKKYISGEDLSIEDIWPSDFTQRGIYNYYSLNVR